MVLRRQCCVCKRVLEEGDPGAPTTHIYCEPCAEAFMAQIDREIEDILREQKEKGNQHVKRSVGKPGAR